MTEVNNKKENNKKILLDYFLANVETYSHRTFLTQPMGGNKVETFSFIETLTQAQKVAGYIVSLNLPPQSQIAICSKNCAWWIMADLAIVMAGHVTVPIFPTLTKETTRYTLDHSDSQLLFLGKMEEASYQEMKNAFPHDMPTISFPLRPKDCEANTSWENILNSSSTPTLTDPVPRDPEEMATIIYTSGSTGKPKGVMTSFQAMLAATAGMCEELKVTVKDRYLSYLPVAHGMERWVGECVPLYSGEQVFFAESLSTFLQDLNRCQPTMFLSVPRLWTKFQSGIFAKIPEHKLDRLLKIPGLNYLLKRLLLKKLGLHKVRMAGSGSAPLAASVLSWYRRLGLELNEGYGMTENFNYSHMARKGRGKVGFVGETWPEVQCRISEDGEIQVRTPGKMMGYYKDEAKTAIALTEDGWVRTGDMGMLEKQPNGSILLKITGRTKELFKTSKGKYVAPAPIENLCLNHPLVEMALVTGCPNQARPFVIVQLSEKAQRTALTSDDTRRDMAIQLEAHMRNKVNAKLESHEKLQLIVVVFDEWLPENGFLTPTQKLKRKVIEEFYEAHYHDWYNTGLMVVWHDLEHHQPQESSDYFHAKGRQEFRTQKLEEEPEVSS
mmetsp:Transcript_20336/g.30579  ORF Transcript_20336/g.30579 Transcript_20336/m.30579 type:complete len:611 (-) Transcript_20336:83-1915(-)|eukprot:CAMPEP_0178895590 /NCGR_PEP_ID=MMETSP0786-20121207/677_1 /TAXON_ID=186022 /ORGANISM="Thalassionema frauenfeldii, Strain CCMP 1798" /LENGTH=610 /DNA_ID=CAMNT_0020565849 /DNA_START=168 /DNA_END=2000 /DNA_ORIENTATION=-